MGYSTPPSLSTTRVTVTVTAGNTTASSAHNMGKTPTIIGRPNPNKLDGLDSYGSADDTNITITCQSPVSTDTIFTFDLI